MNDKYPKLAFIGAGNMASSIINGLLKKGWPTTKIVATAQTKATQSSIKQKFGIQVFDNNQQAVQASTVVILCVKPKIMKEVVQELSNVIKEKESLVISVAAGIEINHFNQWLGTSKLRIIRCMPNTPSALGFGMSGLYSNTQCNENDIQLTERLFQSIGKTQWVKSEAMINAVIAISGSGPAYFFLLMEAMIESGVKLGFAKETAQTLTMQTALGAAKMACSNENIDITELRQQVSSPKGTTEQAIEQLQKGNFKNLIDQAMKSAVQRAVELANQ